MVEGQGIDAAEDMVEVLFLDVLDRRVDLREVPEDLGVAVDQSKQTLGECLVGADGAAGESGA